MKCMSASGYMFWIRMYYNAFLKNCCLYLVFPHLTYAVIKNCLHENVIIYNDIIIFA
jgi:hypothetical protein